MHTEHFWEYHLARFPAAVNGCKTSDFQSTIYNQLEMIDDRDCFSDQNWTYLAISIYLIVKFAPMCGHLFLQVGAD